MLPWTLFTCYTKDNQQECFRLSNWFSLRRLGPWMNHLSTFRLTFQNESWYVSLEWYFIYLLFLASVHGFTYETSDFFYSVITFSYIKCFVHSYTVDVVFTLSYSNNNHAFLKTLTHLAYWSMLLISRWDPTLPIERLPWLVVACQWVSARKMQPQCISNGVTTFLY